MGAPSFREPKDNFFNTSEAGKYLNELWYRSKFNLPLFLESFGTDDIIKELKKMGKLPND